MILLAFVFFSLGIVVLIGAAAYPFIGEEKAISVIFERDGWYGAIIGLFGLCLVTAAQFFFSLSQDRKKEQQEACSLALAIRWEVEQNLLALELANAGLVAREKSLPPIESDGNYITQKPSSIEVSWIKSNYPDVQDGVFKSNASRLSVLPTNLIEDAFLFYTFRQNFQQTLSTLIKSNALGPNATLPNNQVGMLKLARYGLNQSGKELFDKIDNLLKTHGKSIKPLMTKDMLDKKP